MGNNNPDGENQDRHEADDDFDIKFDDEMNTAFDALEVHGSDIQRVDPSSRKTMPDVDGVILEKALEIARAAQVDDAEIEDENGKTARPEATTYSPEELSEMPFDEAIYACMTIPPAPNYDSLVAMTRAEETLKALKTQRPEGPQIVIEEMPLKEQLLLDEDFRAAGRVISLMEEAGLDTDAYVYKLDGFARSRREQLTRKQICGILMTFFRNLAGSLLVVLDKRSKYKDDSLEDEAEKIIPEDVRSEKSHDKALILSLQLVVKMGMLYEMRNGDADQLLYEEFAEYLKKA